MSTPIALMVSPARIKFLLDKGYRGYRRVRVVGIRIDELLTDIYPQSFGFMGWVRLPIRSLFAQASTSEMFGKVQESPPDASELRCKLFAHWTTVNYREVLRLCR